MDPGRERSLIMDNREAKNKFWKGVLVGALVMAFVGLVIVGLSAGIFIIGRAVIDNQARMEQEAAQSGQKEARSGQEEQDSAGDDDEMTEEDFRRINSKMEYIQGIVDKYFLFDEEPEDVEDGIYIGMMYGLNDPYAAYYDEDDFKAFQEDTQGEYCGIGAMVQQNILTGLVTVTKVFQGAPAYEAGMLPGDILYKVDGENIAGKELDLLISENIRGEEGTYVTITVVRGEEGKEVDLKIERRQVEVPTVEHEMLEDKVGYISVLQFDSVTAKQFIEAEEDLEKQGMEKLVIDLRDNPGGVLDTAVEMLAYVLPEDKLGGMLIYTEDKNGKGDRYYCKDGQTIMESDSGYVLPQYPMEDNHEITVPMAVLVNGNSASASELFTGALQDYESAIVVGTQTFGKGIVQNLIPLGDGTAIKLTTSRYFIPSGVCIHETGVTPDVVVELDEELKNKAVIEHEEDNQLTAALEALK